MLGGTFEKEKIQEKIQTFDEKIIKEDFWKKKILAQNILKEKKFFENILNNFSSAKNELENLEQLLELASKENDNLVIKDCEKKIISLLTEIKNI